MTGPSAAQVGRWGTAALGVCAGAFLGAGLPLFQLASEDGGYGTPMARSQEGLVLVEAMAVFAVLALRPLLARVPRARLRYGAGPLLALAFLLAAVAVQWQQFGFTDSSTTDSLLGASDRAKEMLPGLLAGWWLLRDRAVARPSGSLPDAPSDGWADVALPAAREEEVVDLTFELLSER